MSKHIYSFNLPDELVERVRKMPRETLQRLLPKQEVLKQTEVDDLFLTKKDYIKLRELTKSKLSDGHNLANEAFLHNKEAQRYISAARKRNARLMKSEERSKTISASQIVAALLEMSLDNLGKPNAATDTASRPRRNAAKAASVSVN